jgi:hypothetical protein
MLEKYRGKLGEELREAPIVDSLYTVVLRG